MFNSNFSNPTNTNALAMKDPSVSMVEEGPTVSGVLAEMEKDIPDLSLRTTVRTFRLLCENCNMEMKRVGEEGVCVLFIKLVCEMQTVVEALALVKAGTNAGRLCSSILKGLSRVDTDESMYRANGGDAAAVIESMLAMYEALSVEMTALAMDDDFIGCMGLNGRQGCLESLMSSGLLLRVGKMPSLEFVGCEMMMLSQMRHSNTVDFIRLSKSSACFGTGMDLSTQRGCSGFDTLEVLVLDSCKQLRAAFRQVTPAVRFALVRVCERPVLPRLHFPLLAALSNYATDLIAVDAGRVRCANG